MQRIFFVLLLVPLFCAVPAHGGMYIVQNEPHLDMHALLSERLLMP